LSGNTDEKGCAMPDKILYTAEALSTGDGRSGHVTTSDKQLDLDLAPPTEMGGSGDGTNPEQLFASGYAACFHSALRVVARRAKADVAGSSVTARVGIGPEGAGYGLAVTLAVALPNVPAEQAQQLADAAHQVCPYSNATRGNIPVEITLV
jgi:osmotically inducible protein OsmC